jgi:hypothetical protein
MPKPLTDAFNEEQKKKKAVANVHLCTPYTAQKKKKE